MGKVLTCPKVGQKALNDLNCPFVHYYSILLRIGSLVFLYFARGWWTISTQNWMSQIFWKFFHLPESGPKRPKMAWFVCLSVTRVFFQDWLFIFFIYFGWSWRTAGTQNWSCVIKDYFCRASDIMIGRFISEVENALETNLITEYLEVATPRTFR